MGFRVDSDDFKGLQAADAVYADKYFATVGWADFYYRIPVAIKEKIYVKQTKG